MATAPFTPEPSDFEKGFQTPSAEQISTSQSNTAKIKKVAEEAQQATQDLLEELGINFD